MFLHIPYIKHIYSFISSGHWCLRRERGRPCSVLVGGKHYSKKPIRAKAEAGRAVTGGRARNGQGQWECRMAF